MYLGDLSAEDYDDAIRRVLHILGPQTSPSVQIPRLKKRENEHVDDARIHKFDWDIIVLGAVRNLLVSH